MEFDFRKDFLTGKATVKLSMGAEAFGIWLDQEGQNTLWVGQLIDKIALLQARKLTEYTLAGDEFNLLLSQSEACVTNHRLYVEGALMEFEEDLSFYDQEIEANCGLEDLLHLLEEWKEFITN